jgi:ribokinase
MELAVIGGVALDYLSRVKDARAAVTQVTEYSENVGGMAYNTAVTCAQLGLRTRLVSAVGRDFPPLKNLKNLTFNLTETDGRTTRSFLFYDDSEERVYFYRGAYHEIDVNKALTYIEQSDWVHFAGVAPCFSTLINSADHDGKIISCNPGYDIFHYDPRDKVVNDLIGKSDYLIISSKEAEHLNKPLDSLVNGAVIVTMGRNGSIVVEKDKRTQIPAHVVDVESPFGAGDTYTGAFIAGMSKEEDLIKAAKMASAAASFAVEERTTTPQLDWKEIEGRAKKL